MAVDSISTYALFQSTLGDVSKLEAELSNAQQQLSSGNKSQDFAGMASEVQQFLSLNASIAKTSQYLNDNQVIAARINTTSSALDQVISVANSLQSLISQRRTGVSNTAAFSTQVQGLWQQLVGQLNISVNGQFLFSGTRTNVAAVDADHFPELQEAGVPDDGYYQGSKQDMVARPQDNISLTYNVRADAEGFQQLFAGLAMAKRGDEQNSDADLSTAEDLVQAGIQGIIAIQASVNANKVQYSTIDTSLRNIKLYWQGLKESIGNTDILAVSTQVAINQGILTAAFQSFAKLTSLRLSDYLK